MSKQGSISDTFAPLSAAESKKALKEIVDLQASAMIWREGEEPRIESSLYVLNPDGKLFSIRMPQGNKYEDAKGYLFEDTTKDFYFSISAPHAVYFLKCKFSNCDLKQASFIAPQIVYKVQRRQHLRLPSSINPTLWVEFSSPQDPTKNLLKRLEDISAGGLSFFVSEEEKPYFPKDKVLTGLKIYNGVQYISASAQIITIRPVTEPKDPSETHRVGVKYTEISNKDVQLIQTFIFQETRKYFSKHI